MRHLTHLFESGTAVGLTDGQLLTRYIVSNDGAAFAALLARHGPMVLATCRAVLRNEQDIEDAFQATFLVLARKAGSVRTGEALGGWLHRVAHRIGIQANIEVERRRRRESDVTTMEIADTTRPAPELDMSSILHGEIERLPDRYRLPVVLCDLEGLSHCQAAAHLTWSIRALRWRLSKARQRLYARLTRRGLTGVSLGVVMAHSQARAAVPAAWANSAVAAATGGSSSGVAIALSQAVIRSMLIAKLKVATAVALVGVGIASAGIGLLGSVGLGMSRLATDPPAPARPAPVVVNDSAIASDKATAPAVTIEVRGRVVDPGGRPVPGATVQAFDRGKDYVPSADVTCGSDGGFSMRVPESRYRPSFRQRDEATYPWLVATAPAFGPGWASAVRASGSREEMTIRLVEDGPPIEGHIVDLEGRPVAGARVQVAHIWFARDGKLSEWLDRAKEHSTDGPWVGLDQLPAATKATTDADGRFRLTGIGRDRIAELFISGPTIAAVQLYVRDRDGPAVTTTSGPLMSAAYPKTYHSRQFEYVAAPTKPIEGVVRDKDTGQPIAGVVLHGKLAGEPHWVMGVDAMTDAGGHYQLSGLPKAAAFQLYFETRDASVPYPKTALDVSADSPGVEPVKVDIALKRGAVVRGRVTDKATGKPVTGSIVAFTFADNPHVNEFPGHREWGSISERIKEEGRYEIVCLPGRGIIACQTDPGPYQIGIGADAIKGYDPAIWQTGGFDTLPRQCGARSYHVLAEVNPDPKTASTTVDLQVDPGRVVVLNVIDADGKPVGGTTATGLTELYSEEEFRQDSPSIQIYGVDPSKPRRVTISHAARKLAGSVFLKGNETGSLLVRLQNWGTITGRIVDSGGKPRGGLTLQSKSGIVLSAEEGTLPGCMPGHSMSPGIPISVDGKFRIEGLVPGLKYSAWGWRAMRPQCDVFDGVTVDSGAVKDLGDLKVKLREDENNQ